MEFRLLGPVEVLAGVRRLETGPPQQRAVLAALVVDAGRPVTLQTLVDRVWGEAPPAGARAALYAHLARLRRTLEQPGAGDEAVALVRRAGGYVLEVDPDRVDVHRFRRLTVAAQDQRRSEVERASLLGEALDLWRGAPLADVPGQWAARLRDSWGQRRLDAVVAWAEGELRLGRQQEVVGPVRELLAEYPLAEALVATLIRALVATGRRAEALHYYATTRARLIDELGAEPGPELRAVHEAVLRGELAYTSGAVPRGHRHPAPRPKPPGPGPARLPMPPTAIIGRDAELAAVLGLLRGPDVRLVTVVGAGGIGKTRLALAAATAMTDELDAVWFVDLAPVTDPALVPATVAAALRVRSEGSQPVLEAVADRLHGLDALLVLDNVEHLLPAAQDVARLLAAAPTVNVLVTSRIALRLRGEREFPLSPLATPAREAEDGGTVRVAEIAASPAVRLFVARAQEVRPPFAVSAETAADVAEICRRLDGIPLALELAAAQARLLTPAGLLARLFAPLDVPAGPVDLPRRQRTLRATVEWSHGLLGPAERVLLARLSVFTGRWTLDAAEAVGSAGDVDVLDSLSSLVAQSLVAVDERHDLEPRFRLLAAVRQYAAERLAERGERDATMDRMVAYLRRVAEDTSTALQGADNRAAAARVDAVVDDLRAAMRWAIDGDDAETAVRLAAPLYAYWWARGMLSEMLDLAEQTAALPSAGRLPPHAGAQLLWARGIIRVARGRSDDAVSLLRDLAQATTTLGDDRLRAHGLTGLALALPPDAVDEIRRLLDEALAIFRRLGDAWGTAFVLSPRGQLALWDGDPAAAAAMHEEALTQADLIDNDHLRAQALNQLGLDAVVVGDLTRARSRLAQSAEVHHRLLDQEGLAYCLAGFAAVALAQGRPHAAARLTGASEGAREKIGVVVWPLLRPLADAVVAAIAAALDPQTYRLEHRRGREMRPVDALHYALQITGDPVTAP